MYEVSPEYLTAIRSNIRTINAWLTLGADIDSTASDDITSVTMSDSLLMSNIDQLIDAEYQVSTKLAVFEGPGIATDASIGLMAPPLASATSPPQIGVWSGSISASDKSLVWTLTVEFGSSHTSALTIYFGSVYATDFTVDFYLDGVNIGSESTSENNQSVCMTEDSYTYDKIVITTSAISHAYRHVRIAELEFGRSVSYGITNLTGDIETVDDFDFTGATSPIKELDFRLNNVGGTYDEDNPSATLDKFQIGLPVKLSYSILLADDSYETVDMGKYYIISRSYDGSTVSVISQDVRSTMASIYPVLTLTTSVSLGAQCLTILSDYGIPHDVDSSLDSIYLTSAHSYTGDTDLLTVFIHIAQRCSCHMSVNREGALVLKEISPTYYGLVGRDHELSNPGPVYVDGYNGISISNGTDTWPYDLRTDTTIQRNTLSISNPLIANGTQAIALKDHIVAGLYSTKIRCDTILDPAMDSTDTVKMATRFTTDSASLGLMHISSVKTSYSGSLKVTVEAMK